MKKIFYLSVLLFTAIFISCEGLDEDDWINGDFSYSTESYVNGVLIKIDETKIDPPDEYEFEWDYNGNHIEKTTESDFFIPFIRDNGQGSFLNNCNVSMIYKDEYGNEQRREKKGINGCSVLTIPPDNEVLTITQTENDYNSITCEFTLDEEKCKLYDDGKSYYEFSLRERGEYTPSGNDPGTPIYTAEKGSTKVTVENLDIAKTYEFMFTVKLHWANGTRTVWENWNVSANPCQFRTKELDQPGNVSITTKRTSATVSFDMLSTSQLHDLKRDSIYYYVFYYKDTDHIYILQATAQGNSYGATIQNLESDTMYHFGVFASNGMTDTVNSSLFTTKEVTTQKALTKPVITNITETGASGYRTGLNVSFTSEYTSSDYEFRAEYYVINKGDTIATGWKDYTGTLSITSLNAGNTYTVQLCVREKEDSDGVSKSEVYTINTQDISISGVTAAQETAGAHSYNPKTNQYRWGTITGTAVNDNTIYSIDISDLSMAGPSLLFVNSNTATVIPGITEDNEELGHFDVYIYDPTSSSAVQTVRNLQDQSYLHNNPEYIHNSYKTHIYNSYLYNDRIFIKAKKMNPSEYTYENNSNYICAICFVEYYYNDNH